MLRVLAQQSTPDPIQLQSRASRRSVRVGSRILVADGSLTIEVLEITSATELRGRCLNTKVLGQRKNVNLPGKAARPRACWPCLQPETCLCRRATCMPAGSHSHATGALPHWRHVMCVCAHGLIPHLQACTWTSPC